MKNELLDHPSTAQDLIANGRQEGRRAEALRMTRIALTQRFGGLDHTTSEALELLDVAALEDVAVDSTLTLEQLRHRLTVCEEVIKRPHHRLSPLGGYRNTRQISRQSQGREQPFSPASNKA